MSTAFLDKIYKEALQLIAEARNYIAFAEGQNEKLPAGVRLRVSYETLRLTARLSQVMTWVLTEKAVATGEIEADQARGEGFSIQGGAFCAENGDAEETGEMPSGLQSLLDRSQSLYQRAVRLESMLKDTNAA